MNHHDDQSSDAALVTLTLSGEREAFGPLLLRYYASVERLCRRLLGPTPEAQDITQEAALQAFLGLAQLHAPSRFGAWLIAIAANLARMELRRRRTLSLDALPEGAPMLVLWAAAPHTPEEIHAAREVHDTIVAALSELSVVNREVAIGFYLDGYSYAELAELLGVPVSTIKGRLFKGRRQLRQRLAATAHDLLKPDRRPRKEHLMEASELIEVKIDSIRKSLLTRQRVVVLRETDGGRYLPIWIGSFEGDAIKMAIEGQQPQRPMTHDLALRLLAPLGAQVQRVIINRLAETTFYAEITLAVDGQVHLVDARPSDAIALAVRSGIPIYAARAVLDTAGTTTELDGTQSAQAESIADQEPELRPFIDSTWSYLLDLLGGAQGPLDFMKIGQIEIPENFPTRELTVDDQPMLAVQLPNSGASAWLVVRPVLWGRFTALLQQMREVRREFTEHLKRRQAEPAPTTAPETTPSAETSGV
jgi:RNA polymerase sigma factor (sigma-70 family)